MARNIKQGVTKTVERILTWFEQLKTIRLDYEDAWIDIARYLHPRINNFETDSTNGDIRTNYILDSSPVRSVRVASDGYQSYMFPRSTAWFKLGLDDEKLALRQEVALWLRSAEKSIYAELARSPFYQEGGLEIDNGLTIGTASCYCEDYPERRCSNYLALHPKEVYVSRNKYGIVDTLFRRYEMSKRNILLEFAKDGIEKLLDKQTIKDYEENPYDVRYIIHAVFPRTDRNRQYIDKVNKPWASIYIHEEEQVELRQSGFDWFPYAVWCCRLNTDEDYGRSPAWDALADTKRLNEIVKAIMQGAQRQARPPMFYPEEMTLDLGPAGKNPYRDFSRPIQPIQTSLSLRDAEMIAEQIRQQINDHFDVPFFLMFNQRQRQEKTATEVAEIAGERAALMTAMVGRIETDFLDPTMQMTIRNSAHAGRMPKLPTTLRQNMGANLKVNYVGPLSNLQKRYHGQQNIMTTFSQALPIIQVFPESADVINAQGAVRTLLQEGGMPPEGINPEEVTAAKTKARAEQMEQAAMADMLEKMGKAAPGLSKKPEAGSPIEKQGGM